MTNSPLVPASSGAPSTDAKARRALRESAPDVLERMIEIAKGSASDAAAVAAGKLVLGIAGYVAPAAGKPDEANAKQMADMTADELRATIERNAREIEAIERRLAEHATPVNAPNKGATGDKARDLLD